jgi:hypothetical protein
MEHNGTGWPHANRLLTLKPVRFIFDKFHLTLKQRSAWTLFIYLYLLIVTINP